MTTGLVAPQAEYSIRVRDGSTMKLVGELSSFRNALFVRRHNAVGSWAIEINADDPLASALAASKAGIQVTRRLRDPLTGSLISSGILFSGPRWGRVRQMKNNTLVASGFDDLLWLQGRIAYQVTTAPAYSAMITGMPGMLRYYKMAETSGTTANDTSGTADNGTYSGGFTLNSGVLLPADDNNPCVAFNGTTGRVSIPTTSLPTGNAPWTMGCWFNLSATPSSTNLLVQMGNWGTNLAAPHIGINASGVFAGTYNGDTAATAVATGTVHFLVGTWDGTTLTCYLDGVPVTTANPGTLSVTQTGAALASSATSTSFFAGKMSRAFISNQTLSAAQVAQLYAGGFTRLAGKAYDTQTGVAETVIRHYVDVNAVSAVNDADGLSRVVPFLALAADSARGSTVSATARDDQLVNADGTGLLQVLGQNGNMGFTITQSGTALTFSQYVPTDRTASVIFSEDLGNLADFSYQEDGPDFTQGGNALLIGGGGTDTGRVFITRPDSASITKWGRFEGYADARDTYDLTTLQQRGDAALAQMAASTQSTLTLAPQKGVVYGQDFNLGDKVSVVVDGVQFTEVVRGVQIDLTSNNAETVTPIVGTPSADVVGNLFGGFVQRKQIAQLRTLTDKLARST